MPEMRLTGVTAVTALRQMELSVFRVLVFITPLPVEAVAEDSIRSTSQEPAEVRV
jgi:hypothetical protein